MNFDSKILETVTGCLRKLLFDIAAKTFDDGVKIISDHDANNGTLRDIANRVTDIPDFRQG
jgi:hypothetical protein